MDREANGIGKPVSVSSEVWAHGATESSRSGMQWGANGVKERWKEDLGPGSSLVIISDSSA